MTTWTYLRKFGEDDQRAIHVIAVEHDGFGFYHAIPEAIWHDPAGLQKALEGYYRDALALERAVSTVH